MFNIKDVVFILQTLLDYKEKSLSIGRKKLSNLAQLNERNLTESKIRTRLRYMADEGVIIIGKTKQGILITEKGEFLLKTLKSKLHL